MPKNYIEIGISQFHHRRNAIMTNFLEKLTTYLHVSIGGM